MFHWGYNGNVRVISEFKSLQLLSLALHWIVANMIVYSILPPEKSKYTENVSLEKTFLNKYLEICAVIDICPEIKKVNAKI